MSAGTFLEPAGGFSALRQFARRERPLERCELCSLGLRSDHLHLIELARRKLLCACDACALLFSGQPSKYKRVPRRIYFLPGFHLSDAEWNGLLVPINMAFFFRTSLEDRIVAMYPSPAGATESLLALESWNEIVALEPVLSGMEPDVEALLVNRLGHARGYSAPVYYLLPIDECYRLVGLIRAYWKGLSGGAEVWQQIAEFFKNLKARSVEPAGVEDATRRAEEVHA
ncbi:MAG: DUF5947 family protein [Terriglobales bacterium]|jgi:hypothetical protein